MPPADVLVVDGDETVRDLFTRALTRAGFAVREAADGAQALQLIREEPPRLIILDLMMPDINSIELLTAIRRQPESSNVPVLVATATATSAYDLRDYAPLLVLRKPFELARLVRATRAMLEEKRPDDEQQ